MDCHNKSFKNGRLNCTVFYVGREETEINVSFLHLKAADKDNGPFKKIK